VIDAAKAIAGVDGLRCAAIPTTLAGSSFTPFHRMPAGVEDFSFVRPALAVCDPALMASAPMGDWLPRR
jgi:alcohol dehydrogenase class IV